MSITSQTGWPILAMVFVCVVGQGCAGFSLFSVEKELAITTEPSGAFAYLRHTDRNFYIQYLGQTPLTKKVKLEEEQDKYYVSLRKTEYGYNENDVRNWKEIASGKVVINRTMVKETTDKFLLAEAVEPDEGAQAMARQVGSILKMKLSKFLRQMAIRHRKLLYGSGFTFGDGYYHVNRVRSMLNSDEADWNLAMWHGRLWKDLIKEENYDGKDFIVTFAINVVDPENVIKDHHETTLAKLLDVELFKAEVLTPFINELRAIDEIAGIQVNFMLEKIQKVNNRVKETRSSGTCRGGHRWTGGYMQFYPCRYHDPGTPGGWKINESRVWRYDLIDERIAFH